MDYKLPDVNMSGQLSCKVHTMDGVTLESNYYELIDVRQSVERE